MRCMVTRRKAGSGGAAPGGVQREQEPKPTAWARGAAGERRGAKAGKPLKGRAGKRSPRPGGRAHMPPAKGAVVPENEVALPFTGEPFTGEPFTGEPIKANAARVQRRKEARGAEQGARRAAEASASRAAREVLRPEGARQERDAR